MNNLYKYETHLHTSEGSGCASSSGAEMAVAHKNAGYTGIIVTDHFFNGNTAVSNELPWVERVEEFCSGYENAKKCGDEIGLSVFFGWEFNVGTAEFLTYGLDKEWLKNHPEIEKMRYPEYQKFIALHGGFTVHAHPFRQRGYIPKITLIPDYTDAVEVFNAGNDDKVFDERALWYAESYGFAITGGSDIHHTRLICGTGILTEQKLLSIHDYISAVNNRQVIICDGDNYSIK